MAAANTTHTGDPPNSKMGGRDTRRRIPRWMDPQGSNGKLQILSLKASNNGNLPKNPFTIAKSIQREAGGEIEDAFTEARGTKYVLKVRSQDQVNKLLKMSSLIDKTPVEVTLHPTLNIVRCVVTSHDALELEEEELAKELAPQGICAVRRITRKTNEGRINTPTLVLTITGTVIPEVIKFGHIRVKTRLYYSTPMLCYNCYQFGHTKMRCDHPTCCENCSKDHPTTSKCTSLPYCKNCNGDHPPNSKKCPVYEREVEIIKLKTEQGLSFVEARKAVGEREKRKSYAEIASTNKQSNNPARLDPKQPNHSELQNMLKQKNLEIDALKAKLEKLEQILLKEKKKDKATGNQPTSSQRALQNSNQSAVNKTAGTSKRSKDESPSGSPNRHSPPSKKLHGEGEQTIQPHYSEDSDSEMDTVSETQETIRVSDDELSAFSIR